MDVFACGQVSSPRLYRLTIKILNSGEETASTDEINKKVDELYTLNKDIEKSGESIDGLNFEERLLEREETTYPQD